MLPLLRPAQLLRSGAASTTKLAQHNLPPHWAGQEHCRASGEEMLREVPLALQQVLRSLLSAGQQWPAEMDACRTDSKKPLVKGWMLNFQTMISN